MYNNTTKKGVSVTPLLKVYRKGSVGNVLLRKLNCWYIKGMKWVVITKSNLLIWKLWNVQYTIIMYRYMYC